MRIAAIGLACCLATSALGQPLPVGAPRMDFADPTAGPSTPPQTAFVSAYLAAVASRRPEAVRGLVHPASIACATSAAALDYLALIHTRDATRTIPHDARIVMRPFDKVAFPYFWTELAALPIEPSDILGIDFSHEERDARGVLLSSKGTTILRLLAPHDGRLHLLEHCLTAKGEELFRAKQAGAPHNTPAPSAKP